MKYLIVQDWESTHGNHAGMVHMCRLLKEHYPTEYEIIVKDIPKDYKKGLKGISKLFGGVKQYWYLHRTFNKEYVALFNSISDKITREDEIFLLEYCSTVSPQYGLSKLIRKRFPDIKIYALSHLTPTFYKDPHRYSKIIKKWTPPIDKLLTLGSSLTDFFANCGVDRSRLSTGLHYVDSQFYNGKKSSGTLDGRLTVIVMGSMQRNYELVYEVCRKMPELNWILCMGKRECSPEIKAMGNVTVRGYMDESELRDLMSQADISLNVMDDTIGSNVISTSLAMGLAMVCSDVGSIRDYCDDTNAVFCQNTPESFISALRLIDGDRSRFETMKKRSNELAQRLSIDNTHRWFSSLK